MHTLNIWKPLHLYIEFEHGINWYLNATPVCTLTLKTVLHLYLAQ